jgi:chromosome segregation ATPase
VQRELASFKERVALLEGRITSAEKAQSEAKTEREESIKEMSAERDRVFRVIESQKAAINAIGATVEKLTLLQAANAERDRAIRDLEARIAKIKELEDQGKATLEQIASLQAMNTERDQVAHEIEAQGVKLNDMEDRWKSTVKNLDSILTDLNSISKSLASEKVLTHQRLGDVEGTVSDRLAQLVVDVEETGKRMDTFEKKTNELSAAVNILYARSRSSDSSGEGSVAGSADGSQRMGTPSSVSQGLHFNPPRAPASMNGGSLKMGPYSTESPTSSTHRATKKRKFKSNLSPRPSAAEEGVKHGC